jgi:Ca2+-binding EF-hand superfamily protein
MFELLNMNRTTYLLFRTMQQWMNKHAFSTKEQTESMCNMEFAKEFFNIVDADASGKTDFDELAMPLIALGLSSDSSFVAKVFRAIYPKKFADGNVEQAEIGLRDFLKIFRRDPVSERLTYIVQQMIIQRRQKALKRQQRVEAHKRVSSKSPLESTDALSPQKKENTSEVTIG